MFSENTYEYILKLAVKRKNSVYVNKLIFRILVFCASSTLIQTICYSQSQIKVHQDKFVLVWNKIPGNPDTVYLDTLSTLNELIKKLEVSHEKYHTYTATMYSIAAYKQKAIKPLLNRFHSDTSTRKRIAIIHTLNCILRNNQFKPTPLPFSFRKPVIPEAKKAMVSLLVYKGYDSLIVHYVHLCYGKSDLQDLLKILSQRKISTVEFYDLLYDIGIDYYFEHKKLPKEMPIDISPIYISEAGILFRPFVDSIINNIQQGKKIHIDKQLRSSREWELLSLGRISNQNEILQKYLTRYFNPTNQGREGQGLFISYIDKELYIYGTDKAREIWLNLSLRNLFKQ